MLPTASAQPSIVQTCLLLVVAWPGRNGPLEHQLAAGTVGESKNMYHGAPKPVAELPTPNGWPRETAPKPVALKPRHPESIPSPLVAPAPQHALLGLQQDDLLPQKPDGDLAPFSAFVWRWLSSLLPPSCPLPGPPARPPAPRTLPGRGAARSREATSPGVHAASPGPLALIGGYQP